MSTWNYRIVKTKGSLYDEYEIREVFYDEIGNPTFCIDEPSCPYGETIEELKEDYELMKKAFDKPVLNYEDF